MSCEKKLPKLKWKKLEAEMKQGYLDNEPAQAEIIRISRHKEKITMPYINYTLKEVEARGEAIYEQQIRTEVEATNKGEFLVLTSKQVNTKSTLRI